MSRKKPSDNKPHEPKRPAKASAPQSPEDAMFLADYGLDIQNTAQTWANLSDPFLGPQTPNLNPVHLT